MEELITLLADLEGNFYHFYYIKRFKSFTESSSAK